MFHSLCFTRGRSGEIISKHSRKARLKAVNDEKIEQENSCAYVHVRVALGCIFASNYENTPIQIHWKFNNQRKKENFQIKNFDSFHISPQNIDCGYSLEQPRRGGLNEYTQSMFLSRNKKK